MALKVKALVPKPDGLGANLETCIGGGKRPQCLQDALCSLHAHCSTQASPRHTHRKQANKQVNVKA